MLMRQVDKDGNWTFGKGQNDYLSKNRAISQNIETRLKEFLGTCYFNLGAGLDWFSLLSANDQTQTNLSVGAVILNTPNVTGILQLLIDFDSRDRNLTIKYAAQTTYSTVSGIFQYDLNPIG